MAQKKLVNTATDTGLEFNYQKAPQYRTVHADGAILSTTPRGLFALTLYNERGVIPRRTRRPIMSESDDSVTLGDEEPIEGLEGIMRQIELTVMMDERTVAELRNVFNMIDDSGESPSTSEADDA